MDLLVDNNMYGTHNSEYIGAPVTSGDRERILSMITPSCPEAAIRPGSNLLSNAFYFKIRATFISSTLLTTDENVKFAIDENI